MHYQLSNVAALVLPRVQNHNRVILEDSWNTNKETHYRDLISQHRPQDNVSISYWLCTSKSPCPILMWPSLIQTCLSHARRNVSMKSLPPKPPDWTYHTQPPAPPDQTSCVLATRGKYACAGLFNAPPSGLELEFDFLANVGSFTFPHDPYVNDACSSGGIYPNYN
ncbi:hypothetical protein L195_g045831, partial [Trifolium pratense]